MRQADHSPLPGDLLNSIIWTEDSLNGFGFSQVEDKLGLIEPVT